MVHLYIDMISRVTFNLYNKINCFITIFIIYFFFLIFYFIFEYTLSIKIGLSLRLNGNAHKVAEN